MSQHTSKQSVPFENLSTKAVTAPFEQDHAGSDGGAFLFKAGVLNAPVKEQEGKSTAGYPAGWKSISRRIWDHLNAQKMGLLSAPLRTPFDSVRPRRARLR